jgi:hypothetical protein
MPLGSTATGMAYALPSIEFASKAPSEISDFTSAEMPSVMSMTWPAATVAASLPPPRCR